MTSRLALVTASDSTYLSLLRGLLESVRAVAPSGAVDLCVIDLGLSPEERTWLEGRADQVADGRWDIDFPDRDDTPRQLQGLTCRPFLPSYFPGYEVYFWLDADAWVQDWGAVELFRRAALEGSLGVVPELDAAYSCHYDGGHARRWTHQRYRIAFGKEAADVLWWNPLLNAGAFSLGGDSPGWNGWADLLERGTRRTLDAVDQTALNVLVHADELDARFLPSTANWLCGWATPALNEATGRLVHPLRPWEALGIVHLTGQGAKAAPVAVETVENRVLPRWLTYRGEPR